MTKPTVLLTGANGFLGSYVLYYLLEKGYDVTAMKHKGSKIEDSLYIMDNLPKLQIQDFTINWIEGDIMDMDFLEDAMRGKDWVIHTAAKISFNPKHRKEVLRTNVEGTANVVNACLSVGVKRLGYVSSIAAVARVSGKKVSEKDTVTEFDFSSTYSQSKYMAEMEVWRGVAEGLDAVLVNPGIILGWGNFLRGSPELFNNVAKGLSFYPMGSNGFVDARDVANGLLTLMEKDRVNERFILVSENLSYKDLLGMMAKELGVRVPSIHTPYAVGYILYLWFSLTSKLTGKTPLITKELAITASKKYEYDNGKAFEAGVSFRTLEETVKEVAKKYLANN